MSGGVWRHPAEIGCSSDFAKGHQSLQEEGKHPRSLQKGGIRRGPSDFAKGHQFLKGKAAISNRYNNELVEEEGFATWGFANRLRF